MKTFSKLLKIEMKLSIRDMNLIVFAIIMPLIVMAVIGLVFGTKPAFKGANYTFLEQSFGALCSIAICASGLMGIPTVVSDYRERKILKRFQMSPVSPSLILAVDLCMYTIYCIVSVITLWILGKMCWGISIRGNVGMFLVGWLLVLISIQSIGMLVGGIAKNNKFASVIASILYFPMLVFSGATVPYEVMPKSMQHIVDIFPVTQGIKILKATTLGENINALPVSITVLLLVAAICVFLSIKLFRWE